MVQTPASDFLSLAARFEEEAEGKNCGGGGVYKEAEEGTNPANNSPDFGKEITAGFSVGG